MSRSMLAYGLVLGVFVGGAAQAQELEEPGPEKPVSGALLLGFGGDFEDGELNMFGLGFGARGGYTLDMNVYLGGQLLYFFGDSYEFPGGEASNSLFTIGVEAGYDLPVEMLLVRPSLGLGLAIMSSTLEMGALEADNSESELYLAPGATVIYPLENDFFVGGDLRLWHILADESVTGVTLMVTGGMQFAL